MDLELDLESGDDGIDLALDGDGLGGEETVESTRGDSEDTAGALAKHRGLLLAAAAAVALLILVAAGGVTLAVFFAVSGDNDTGGDFSSHSSDSNSTSAQVTWSYGVVVDLGSSGSRGHVFQWTDARDVQQAPGSSPYWFIKVKPGVSSYAEAPEDAALSLVPVLDYCIEQLQSANATLEEVPIFLYATAGLRLVGEDAAEAVLEAIRSMVSNDYPFVFEDDWARVIDGSEEATFDWLSAQQLIILDPSLVDELTPEGGTLGLVDMGGASFEVSFEAEIVEGHEEEFSEVTVGGEEFSIYRHSYLPYGHNAAREGLQAQLFVGEGSNTTAPVVNPCFLEGYNETLALPSGEEVTYFGGGDALQCSAAVLQYFNMSAECLASSSCSIHGTFQAPLSGSYMGIDDLARVIRFFSLESSATPRQILDAASLYCARPWAAAQAAHAGQPDTGVDVAYYCFEGVYAAQVLASALHFDWDATDIVIADSLHGIELSWALGAMVYNYPLVAE